VFVHHHSEGNEMKMKMTVISIAIVTMMAGNVPSMAQPGAAEQDRGIRQDNGQRGTTGQGRRERVIVPESERERVPAGRYYGEPPEPPGGDFQDKGINDDAGKPPGGEDTRRR
jgi:hypothetical protein